MMYLHLETQKKAEERKEITLSGVMHASLPVITILNFVIMNGEGKKVHRRVKEKSSFFQH